MIHLVRVGALAHVGRFRSVDLVRCPRGARVVVRTQRGLELGEVVADDDSPADSADGELLRRVTVSDELLAERLERNRHEAYHSCAELLAERGSSATLIDVEHLFDGRGLYFYFLGEVDAAAETLTSELADAYDAEARFGQFAEAVTHGCGPGCGTEEAQNGCGSAGGCATCSVAKACGNGG